MPYSACMKSLADAQVGRAPNWSVDPATPMVLMSMEPTPGKNKCRFCGLRLYMPVAIHERKCRVRIALKASLPRSATSPRLPRREAECQTDSTDALRTADGYMIATCSTCRRQICLKPSLSGEYTALTVSGKRAGPPHVCDGRRRGRSPWVSGGRVESNRRRH